MRSRTDGGGGLPHLSNGELFFVPSARPRKKPRSIFIDLKNRHMFHHLS